MEDAEICITTVTRSWRTTHTDGSWCRFVLPEMPSHQQSRMYQIWFFPKATEPNFEYSSFKCALFKWRYQSPLNSRRRGKTCSLRNGQCFTKTHSAADRKTSQCYSGLHFCQLRLWQGITFNESMLIASQRYPFTLIYSQTNCVELDARSRELMQAMHGMQPPAYAWGLEQGVKLIITPWILTPWENRSDCINMCHPLHWKQRLHWKESMTIGNGLAYLFACKRPKDCIKECPFLTLHSFFVFT